MVVETLSHYRIVEKLGEGGMGEVYRAEDTTLGREVALKCLPDEFTADAERLARFEREARILAALNHPHIAQIYSFERFEDRQFLVLELIEGDTLTERLLKGRIAAEEALGIALQITRALEAAHDRGIIHRDLKPSNIKITPEGQVKVLDFGIAKPVVSTASSEPTHAPTAPYPTTRNGLVFGTPAYMSPEQIRAQRVDKRTDLWSFGVVLWEMLTGERPYEGQTDSDLLAAVLQTEPDLESLPPTVPLSMRRLLHRCLTKDLEKRLHDIADARLEIEEALRHSESDIAKPRPDTVDRRTLWNQPKAYWWMLPLAAALGSLLASSAIWLSRDEGPTRDRGARRWAITIPSDQSGVMSTNRFAASPDDRWLVVSAKQDGTWRLFKRSVDRFGFSPIPGTENATDPIFSPDSRWVGFLDIATEKLKKIPLEGGTSVPLADTENLLGASWGPDGTIVYAPFDSAGLWRVPAVGGEPEILLRPSAELGAWNLFSPTYLPDGKAVLFTGFRGLAASSAFVGLLEIDSLETKVLIDKGSGARYIPSGHLIYHRADRLEVVPFSLETREVSGPAAPIPDAIMQRRLTGFAWLSFSNGGTLYFTPGTAASDRRLVSVGLDGEEATVLDSTRHYCYPRYSPDGSKLAVTVFGRDGADLWTVDLRTGVETKLTSGGGVCNSMWSPEGDRLVFARDTSDPPLSVSMFTQMSDGTRPQEVLLPASEAGEMLWPYSLSQDGRLLVYGRVNNLVNEWDEGEIWILQLDIGETRPFLAAEGVDYSGADLSPDGLWIAYGSNTSGRRYDIYVQSLKEGGKRVKVSADGGSEPVWAPDSRQLYFLKSGDIMHVPISTEGGLRAGAPGLLLEDLRMKKDLYDTHPSYDLSPDGHSFVFVRETTPLEPAREIRVIQNWFEELERLAPTHAN